jgi:hypothetical protein
MNRRTRYTLFPVCVVALVLCACAARVTTVTNLPPGVTVTQVQTWDTAVANLDKFSQSLTTVRQSVQAAHNSGAFPDGPEYTTVVNAIGRAAQVELEASKFLRGVPNDWSATTQQTFANYTAQIAQALEDAVKNGTTGIKNASAEQQVITAITNAAAIMGIALAAAS